MMLYCSSTCLFGEDCESLRESVRIRNGKLFSLVSVVSGRNVFLNVYEIVFLFPTSLFLSSHKPSHIYEFTTYNRGTDTRGRVKPPKKIYTTRPEKYSQPAWRNAMVVFVFCCSFSTGKYSANENKQRDEKIANEGQTTAKLMEI